MFRLVLIAIFALLTVVGGVSLFSAVEQAAEPMEEQLKGRVQLSHKAYAAVADLRNAQLEAMVKDISDSEVQAYLAVLEGNRKGFLQLETDAFGRFPGEQRDERAGFIADQAEFLNTVTEDLAKRIEVARGAGAWKDQPRAEFVKQAREDFTSCIAIAVDHCMFEMTRSPLKDEVDSIRNSNRHGTRPDLVVVADSRGTGRADVDRPKWSKVDGFSEQFPLLRKAKSGRVVHDVVELSGKPYFVAAGPISDGGASIGTLMVGVALDGSLLAEESQTLGWKVSYLDGKKLIKTSLSEPRWEELLLNLPQRSEDPQLALVETDNLMAQVIPLKGAYSNQDVMAVLSADRTELLEPLEDIKAVVPLFSLFGFLVGVIIFITLIRHHTRPLVEIDSGIHEIITGNHDYEFKSDYSDKLWVSFAKSLNRMVGILQGRDLEEDDLEEYMGVVTRETAAVQVPDSFMDDDDDDEEEVA
ncbi:MAG: hypothetical protein CL940_05015 [Deltaproteobacteria bacterium]|nr:hypothetical protein [Deltaproteobacteria bacterium]